MKSGTHTINADEYCCSEPNLCYVHLVKNGFDPKEAAKIIEMRDLTPELKEKNNLF